ncbi:MAG TPA: gfo/Idh/MocA family oxidoreductase [Armatimonadetes bacterium]|nr:gfo/Idh/MocA family oxidoreductase [Armatimonadota bacterium]
MSRRWRVAILKDTSKPMLGLHGLHTAFRDLPDVEVVAHVDANAADLERKMAWTGARRHYATLPEMLASEAPDIVVLCSRHPGDHLGQIEAAAAAGCHIYCEKPLTASLREADRIVALAEQEGIRICMAHPGRYALVFRTMKAMLEAGEIGQPLTVYGLGKCDHRGGGEDLIVLGTHILDLQTFLLGEPEHVYAAVTAGGRPVSCGDRTETVEPIGPAAGDSIYACFGFPGGVRGVFESRRGLYDREPDGTLMGITVSGTEGALSMRFDDAATRTLRISRSRDPLQYGARFEDVPLREDRVIPGAEPLDYSLCGQKDIPRARYFLEANRFAAWDLMRAIEKDRQPLSNVTHARLALEMIYGIYAAHLARGLVSFPLRRRDHPLEECM